MFFEPIFSIAEGYLEKQKGWVAEALVGCEAFTGSSFVIHWRSGIRHLTLRWHCCYTFVYIYIAMYTVYTVTVCKIMQHMISIASFWQRLNCVSMCDNTQVPCFSGIFMSICFSGLSLTSKSDFSVGKHFSSGADANILSIVWCCIFLAPIDTLLYIPKPYGCFCSHKANENHQRFQTTTSSHRSSLNLPTVETLETKLRNSRRSTSVGGFGEFQSSATIRPSSTGSVQV